VLRFQQYLEEGVNDPAIFKAVFLAGGPGSGKSFIVGKTGLTSMGYKVVNSDDAFEAAMKKADMKMTPDNIFSPKGQELRGKAKRLTGTKQARYIKGRLGLVIDGTGKDPEKIARQAQKIQTLGYKAAMIFVNTDLDTALKRNRMRERSLPDAEVEAYWKAVQRNTGKFQRMFGKENFLVVDNSEGKNYEKETLRAYRDVRKFTDQPHNKKAQKWIDTEKAAIRQAGRAGGGSGNR
jgi:predicted kinase